jgi:hypothetical protein
MNSTARKTAGNKQVAAIIAKIAKERLGFETLEARMMDSLDFREVSVWSVQEALEMAYAAGLAACKKAA